MKQPSRSQESRSAPDATAQAELEIDVHARQARRRANWALVAVVVGLAMVIWASVNVRRIDADATHAGADTSITVLSSSTAPYLIALAIGLLAAFVGVLVATLSWMYVRHLNQARAKVRGADGH